MTAPTEISPSTAAFICSPAVQAGLTLHRLNDGGSGFKETTVAALYSELLAQIKACHGGDL